MFNRHFQLLWPFILVTALPVLAQSRGGALTIHYAFAGPLLALTAGILILIVPRILNYVVAIYLILVGLIGIFGR